MPGAYLLRIGAVLAFVGLAFARVARGAPLRTDTWVVDDDGPANFRDLRTAVDAARDGDTLVLRPGRYEAVSIVRKGLRIVGAGPSAVTIERTKGDGPFFEARELTARQNLVLAGVRGVGRGATITIERCGGLVLLADLVVENAHPTLAGGGPSLNDCANAVLARVAVLPGAPSTSGTGFGMSLSRGTYSLSQVVAVGPTGAPAKSPRGKGGVGAVGLAIEDAKVQVARSEFVGGAGGPATWDERAPFCPEAATAGTGGAGLYVAGECDLLVAGTGEGALRGGDGGAAAKNPWDQCWSFAGDGGPGVRVRDDDEKRTILFSSVEATAGEPGVGEATRAGRAGVAIDGAPDAITTSETILPTIALDQPGVAGGTVTLKIVGPPGGLVTLLISSEVGRTRVKGKRGFPLQTVPGDFWMVVPLGRLDETGRLELGGQIPVDHAVVGRTLAVQAMVSSSPRGKRESYLTNVDVLAIADGSAPPVAGR
jgi:hypothetical protein